MGARLNRVPLSKVAFHFVPKGYKIKMPEGHQENDELQELQRTYTLCFLDIFQKPTHDSTNLYADQILQAAKTKKCNVRLFIHAAMIGYARHQQTLIGHTDQVYANHCHPKFLTTARAASYVDMYRELCASKFGSFGLHEIDSVNKSQYADSATHTRLLYSEVTAGKYLVAAKASTSGPLEEDLYFHHELQLDPFWLAIEPSYETCILEKYIRKPYGTEAQKRHRFNVTKAVSHFKGSKTAGIAIHLARAQIMSKAMTAVLATHHFHPDEFEIANEAITNAFSFWKDLGRLIQQLYCLRLYHSQVDHLESSSTEP